MFNHVVQLAEIVAGDGGIHMMFDVVIHVPVQKAQKRVENDGARIQAIIADIIRESRVLGFVTQELQCTAIKRGESHKERDLPQTKSE